MYWNHDKDEMRKVNADWRHGNIFNYTGETSLNSNLEKVMWELIDSEGKSVQTKVGILKIKWLTESFQTSKFGKQPISVCELPPPSWHFDVWKLCELEENLENSPSARPIRAWELTPLHGLSMCGDCVNWKKIWKTAHQRVPLGRGSWPHFMAFRCVEIVWVGRKCKARAWFWFFRRLKLVFDWMNSASLLQLLTPPHCDVVSWWKEELKRWLRMKWQVMACIPREERHLNNFPLAAHIVCSCVCPNWRSGKTPVVASWYWNEMSVQIEYHLLVLRWQRNLHFSKHFKPTSSICWWLRVLASNWMACPKMGNV